MKVSNREKVVCKFKIREESLLIQNEVFLNVDILKYIINSVHYLDLSLIALCVNGDDSLMISGNEEALYKFLFDLSRNYDITLSESK